MKTVGITAEYDPFHLGHLYQLQKAREVTGADCVVVALGGDFLQRGTPSLVPKAVRARMAVENGADLVLALPYIYSVSSAREYAAGAVDILAGTGCVDEISFGCENDDPEALGSAVSALLNEDLLAPFIQEGLSQGRSFPSSFTGAVEQMYGRETADVLRSPNNLLACEYMRAAREGGAGLKPVPVRRVSNGAAEDVPYLSASRIRGILKEQGAEAASPFVPAPTEQALLRFFGTDPCGAAASAADREALKLLKYRAMTADRSEIRAICDVSEGIEGRFFAAAGSAGSVGELADRIKTKRYTRSRIMRMLTHILMNFRAEEFEQLKGSCCARVLAADARGRELLKRMRKTSSIPVVSNLSRPDRYDEKTRRILELDVRAAGLYSFIHGEYSPDGERKYVPYMG